MIIPILSPYHFLDTEEENGFVIIGNYLHIFFQPGMAMMIMLTMILIILTVMMKNLWQIGSLVVIIPPAKEIAAKEIVEKEIVM